MFLSQRNGISLIKIYFVMLLFLAATILQAQETITHDISTGNLSIPGASTNNYIITGQTSTYNVVVGSGYSGDITLKDLKIIKGGNTSCINIIGQNETSNLSPVTKVNLILDGTNELMFTSNSYCAIQVNQGAQVHIKSVDPNNNASGILWAKSNLYEPGSGLRTNGGAGIGARNYGDTNTSLEGSSLISDGVIRKTAGGNIIISSGTITAWGGHAAGIGGGWYSYYNGVILIYGGIVESRAGYHAAGIGSGCPTGKGVVPEYPEESAVIALPPSSITAFGTHDGPQLAEKGLTGTKSITYMNDPNKSLITVRTEDFAPNVDIYLDLTETMGLQDIFDKLGVEYDLTKAKIGTTDASGILQFRAQFEQNTTFFTNASSPNEASLGRPYMPVETTVIGDVNNEVEIILPLLGTEISFTDYPSTPLEEGYTAQQARQNAYKLKMVYSDPFQMENVSFRIQEEVDFNSLVFLASDGITEVSTPTTLNGGDVYYIELPISVGRSIGLYSDVLLINGDWKSIPLPGYIRRVGEQAVIADDTGDNRYIQVTASPDQFVTTPLSGSAVGLSLSINHQGSNISYNPANVIAKYLITTEADYDTALASTPLSDWSLLDIPINEIQSKVTTVSFDEVSNGSYYIHWYVESGPVSAHSQSVIIPALQYGGFGPYVISDPVVAGRLHGNPFVCDGQSPMEIKGEESTGGSGVFSYRWQKSLNLIDWVDVGTGTQNYMPEILTVSPTYYRRLTIDVNIQSFADTSNVFRIDVVANNQTLYWRKDAADRNWHNPSNWVDVSGASLNIVPLACTDVFIPSGAVNYPSLKVDDTPTEFYGLPVCNKITFAYGAELAYQHRLIYQKAYVHYDMGVYNDFESGTQPVGVTELYIKRDRWYTLAAPLKKMASGDFVFGGYPFTWQALSDGIAGEDNFYSINFEKSHVDNAVDLSASNNSIAIKVASYKAGVTGYSDHEHIQALDGILEIPYFNNAQEVTHHPGHSYDPVKEESFFYYYNEATLQTQFTPFGRMKRSYDAYRFVFENDKNKVDSVTVQGELVPCYVMQISPNHTHRHALIGNPFIASIDMKKFFDVNSDVLEDAGYYIYGNSVELEGTWINYPYSENNGVSSFQGFVVVFKTDAANQTLVFPLEGAYGLTGTYLNRTPQKSSMQGVLNVSVYKEDGSESDISELIPVHKYVGQKANVRKLVNESNTNTPEVFFVDNHNADFNSIQTYSTGDVEIAIGVRCADVKSTQTLHFNNLSDFAKDNKVRLVLYDQFLDEEQDLAINSRYSFVQCQSRLNKLFTDANRFILRFDPEPEVFDVAPDNLEILYTPDILRITSTAVIKIVSVYDMQGRLVYRDSNVGKMEYSRQLLLGNGIYIVRVETASGNVRSEKIMVKE